MTNNQNFSKVARVVDEYGAAVILKNNVPRYLVIDFSKAEKEKIASVIEIIVFVSTVTIHTSLFLYCTHILG